MDVIMEFATPIGMFYTKDTELTTGMFSKVLETANDNTEDVYYYINQSRTTPDDLNTKESYAPLVSFIEQKAERFSEEVLGIKKDDIELHSMWSNIHNSGSKHHYHQHPNAFLSGVFYPYIAECKEPGNIVFVDPRQAKNMVYADFFKSSCISNRNIWVTPETGLLLLFPSWLEHGTDPFIGFDDQKRVSISFNYQLRACTHKTMRI
jgi:uncharacterized protein (TIGR02466 family)